MVKVRQGHTHQRVVGGDAVLDQFKALAAELLALDGAGEPQHTRHFARGCLFGVDHHRKPQLVAHKMQLLLVFRVADTGNGVLGADFFGDHTGKNVDLVAGGGGDQQVGTVFKRFFLHVVAGTVAGYAAHVIDVDEIIDQGGVLIHHHDVVFFCRKLCRQGTTHLAQTDDHDPHKRCSFVIAPRRTLLLYCHYSKAGKKCNRTFFDVCITFLGQLPRAAQFLQKVLDFCTRGVVESTLQSMLCGSAGIGRQARLRCVCL